MPINKKNKQKILFGRLKKQSKIISFQNNSNSQNNASNQ
jgi:hypothetical protein